MVFDSIQKEERFWEDFPEQAKENARRFFLYLDIEKSFSIHTKEAYLQDLKAFLIFCQIASVDYLQIDALHVRSYFSQLSFEQNLDKKSQRRKLSSLRSFYKYLFNQEIIADNPILDVRFPKIKKNLPKNFSVTESTTILESEIKKKSPFSEYRDKAILEVFYSTGMRVFELVNSRWENLSSDFSQLKILGKGNKERFVFLGENAILALKDYQLFIPPECKSEYIFLNHRGKQITTRGVQFLLEEYRKKLGWDKKIHPHKFRHTFATDMLNEGADIRYVQEMLGHASLSSTQIYLSVSKERLKEVYRKSHPHAKLKQDD